MKRILGLIILVLVGFYLYSTFFGIKGLEVHEYNVEDSKIPNSFNGFSIAHFSDLLYGSINNIEELEVLVNKINSYKPDVIVFTGNLISNEITLDEDDLDKVITQLKKLEAKQKKYCIYGDIDLENIDQFKKIMDSSNFVILDNKNELLFKLNNNPILIAGITDLNKVDEALKNDTDSVYNLALLSKPDDTDKLTGTNINTIFAGNSLGGLIKIPFVGGVIKQDGASKYLEGKYQINETLDLYVSTGIGTRNLHFRAFNKPSFNIYRLYNKAA